MNKPLILAVTLALGAGTALAQSGYDDPRGRALPSTSGGAGTNFSGSMDLDAGVSAPGDTSATTEGGASVGVSGRSGATFRNDRLARLDRDGDGALSANEIERDSELEKYFLEMDKDGDGQISAVEYSRFSMKHSTSRR